MYHNITAQAFIEQHEQSEKMKSPAIKEKEETPTNKAGYIAGDLKFNPSRFRRPGKKKSLAYAYFLWLCGGYFGLHLIYLERDEQALVYWWTLGGYLGLGVMRDFFRLPTYVRDINDDENFIADLANKMRKKHRPGFFSSLARLVAQVVVGNLWYLLIDAAVPKEEILGINIRPIAVVIAPAGAAIAVWMIGNIGREVGDIKWALAGSYSVVFFVPFFGLPILNWCSVISVLLFNICSRKWRRNPYPKHSKRKRFCKLALWSIVFSSLFSSFLYFNATIHSNKEQIKFRDAVGNFLRSPMFQEFKTNTYKVYNDTWHEGPTSAFHNLIDLLDPLGKTHAFKVLELPRNATQGAIKERVRQLSKKWHPDKQKTDEEKKIAEVKFMEVQEAGDALLVTKIKQKNSKKKSHE